MANVISLGLAILLTGQAPVRRTPVVEVVEKAGPAVVNIGAEIIDERSPFRHSAPSDEMWREFFGQPRERRQTAQSLGSGVIIDKTGLVLTNEHVVSRASSITVTLGDRRTLRADVVGADPAFDLAVLKVRTDRELPAVVLGTSSDLMPGEPAIAIGNPFGLTNTVTTGVVSALHRSIQAGERSYEDFIQTDAAINPGNSGGALLNIEGKLIGINTAIHNGGQGIGFAIPIDKAKAVVEEVLRYGEVRPVFLGIDVDQGAGPHHGVPGAHVRAVQAGSAGEGAGVQPGDLIVDVGGEEVKDARGFAQVTRGLVPGQQVLIRVVRGGKTMDLTVKVRELTPDKAVALGRARLGLDVKAAKGGGLMINDVKPGSEAARIGIQKGDALLSIGGRNLRSLADFEAICGAIRDAEAVSLIIGRGGRAYYVTLRLG